MTPRTFFQRVLGIEHINKTLEEIKLKQSELATELRAQSAHLEKIGKESSATLKKVTDLETALSNSGEVSDEVKAALEGLKTQAQAVDDLVQDIPEVTPPTSSPGNAGPQQIAPAAETTAAPSTVGVGPSTIVEEAVANAAAKATTALGDVQEAVTNGGDVSDAVEDLKTAHAELAGVNENDTTAAEQKVADATEAVLEAASGDNPSTDAPAALQDLNAAHNELIAAASGEGASAPDAATPGEGATTPADGASA